MALRNNADDKSLMKICSEYKIEINGTVLVYAVERSNIYFPLDGSQYLFLPH